MKGKLQEYGISLDLFKDAIETETPWEVRRLPSGKQYRVRAVCTK
jgi:hypothetical protein